MEIQSENNRYGSLAFLTEASDRPVITEDIVILHMISGSAVLEIGNSTASLKKNDIYLVNMNTVFELRLSGEALCAVLRLSGQHILNLLGRLSVEFESGADRKGESSCQRLEALLWRIYEIVLDEDRNSRIQMLSLYYQLTDLLYNDWIKEDAEKNSSTSEQEALRDMQIMQFIHNSYSEPITLEMLSKKLFLSNAYLSKYIKKRFGMNYVELLNTVRLTHATEALKRSSDSITRIALSNGFSTVAAFNGSFRKAHGVSPSEYRKTVQTSGGGEIRRSLEISSAAKEIVRQGIDAFREQEQRSGGAVLLSQEVDAFAAEEELLPRSWKKVINVGTAYNLTRSDYQQQLLFLHERIGFEYVRFWDVFSPELRINLHADPQYINFHTLFMIIDFLIDHGMKPFLELGIKPIRISRSTADAVIDSHRKDEFSSPAELKKFTAEFSRQLVSRYGQREVGSWYFEYWKKDPVLFYAGGRKLCDTDDNLEQYLAEFDALCEGIKSAVPNARIGGGGFTFRSYGDDGIRAILRSWKTHRHLPDFLSFNCYCYRNVDFGDQRLHQMRYEDPDYINTILTDVRRIMKEADFPERNIYVTEFNLTVSNRNPVNDSCIKAAELMRLLLNTARRTEVLSYWTALDTYAEYSDTSAVIFGGVGLLTKDSITKPAFFVYDFLNRLDDEIVAWTQDYIISRQGAESFKIVCHNFRGFTKDFYAIENEDTIGIRDISNYICDQREKRIRLTLRNIPNGKYQIRMREVDQHSGSIQSIWQRLNYDERLDREDIRFIRQMCIPSMWRMETEIYNGVLEFEIKLAPNAIKYAHFILKKS